MVRRAIQLAALLATAAILQACASRRQTSDLYEQGSGHYQVAPKDYWFGQKCVDFLDRGACRPQ
jgi:hypothetical protein